MINVERQGLVRYCINEADSQFGRTPSLRDGGFMPSDNNVYNSPSYTALFEPMGWVGGQKERVLWFGEPYPVSALYQNATATSATLQDS